VRPSHFCTLGAMVGRKLTDARGASRYAMSTTQTDRSIRREGIRASELADDVRAGLTRNERIHQRLVPSLFVVAFLTLGMAAGFGNTLFNDLGGWLMLVGIVSMLAAILAHRWFRSTLNDLRPFALGRRGFCVCCGYRVGDLPPEPDGCTLCPECGAAWRVSGAPGSNEPRR